MKPARPNWPKRALAAARAEITDLQRHRNADAGRRGRHVETTHGIYLVSVEHDVIPGRDSGARLYIAETGEYVGAIHGPAYTWSRRHDASEHGYGDNKFVHYSQKGTRLNVGSIRLAHAEAGLAAIIAATAAE